MFPLLYTKPNQLPTEVQAWLDGHEPLPKTVRFYPVSTKSLANLFPWLALAVFFLSMGTAAPIALVSQFMRNGFTPRTGYFLFGALFLLGFLVMLLYGILAGALRDAQLTLSKRNGRLRHGIFVTPQDLLIRLPHEMHYLPRYSIDTIQEISIQRGSRQIKAIQFDLNETAVEQPLVVKPQLVIPQKQLLSHLQAKT